MLAFREHDVPERERGVAAAATSLAHADRMYAVDASTDGLYIFDSETGRTLRTIGPLNPDPDRYTTPISMAVTDGFQIFVINNSPARDAGLSVVDRRTGRAFHIGGDVRNSIAFGPGGVLYGTDASGRLGTVSTTTGNVTRLSGPRLLTLYGLDYNPRDGFLYGIISSASGAIPDLVRLSTRTGEIVATIPLSRGIDGFVPGSIAFESDGDLIMTDGSRQVYEINPTSGFTRVRTSSSRAPQGLGLAPCLADVDASGELNVFDFLEFQNLFDAGNPEADLDGDGALTILDFLAFQNEFDAGCD